MLWAEELYGGAEPSAMNCPVDLSEAGRSMGGWPSASALAARGPKCRNALEWVQPR